MIISIIKNCSAVVQGCRLSLHRTQEGGGACMLSPHPLTAQRAFIQSRSSSSSSSFVFLSRLKPSPSCSLFITVTAPRNFLPPDTLPSLCNTLLRLLPPQPHPPLFACSRSRPGGPDEADSQPALWRFVCGAEIRLGVRTHLE